MLARQRGVRTSDRAGELAVSRQPGEVLPSISLGSYIGLAPVARTRSTVGLAHVMLPESQGRVTPPGKFADLTVQALLAQLELAS